MVRRKKKQPIWQNKIVLLMIAPVLGAIGLYLWNNITAIWAMGEKQQTYEDAYVQTSEFVQEQRTYNELVQQQVELMQQDQQRQWAVILQDRNNESYYTEADIR